MSEWGKTVVRRLRGEYPEARCALTHADPYQLTVSTILSAQCTDEMVNKVTPALFAKYPTADDLAKARLPSVEKLVKSTGFFRNKARNITGMAKALVKDFGGKVPQTMDELLTLPGVARKTANVVLGVAFGKAEGVVVDTHVRRLSRRLGLTKEDDPVRIEKDLMEALPRSDWIDIGHLLIWHGRRVCSARKPRCGGCVLNDRCPSREE
ncbi:MAG: endonuclease III [Planctomycetes bacterium]|nr:endonuclease III [Planctomycetota bacterium]